MWSLFVVQAGLEILGASDSHLSLPNTQATGAYHCALLNPDFNKHHLYLL
jgi:hypothetical protein